MTQIASLRNALTLTISLIFTCARAAVPAGYYNACENQSGETLLKTLSTIISNHNNIGYDGLWTLYHTSDVRDNGKIWDMYSTKEWTAGKEQCGNYKVVGDCYNREHSFPKSWFSQGSPMVSDAFHIYPTDGKVNSQRGNYPYGECAGGTQLSSSGSVKPLGRLGNSTFSGYSGVVFEPDDEYKGDFARSYFYMATRYNSAIHSWSSPMLAGNSYPAFTPWAVELLLKWHRQDPVSKKETDRNDAVYARQNNRNPYIDHPEMVEYIWGNKSSEKWTAAASGIPEIIMPVDGSTIDMGITIANNHALTTTITVRGINLNRDVTLSCPDNRFSVSPAKLQASAVNSVNGATVTVTFSTDRVGSATATLNIESGSNRAEITLQAEAVNGLPVKAATAISEDAFTANWTYVGDARPGEKYLLTVTEAADANQIRNIEVDAKVESYEVEGLKEATTYNYQLHSATLSSKVMSVTTATPLPAINFYYDGDLNFSAEPGSPSMVAEIDVETENIDSDIIISVDEPFEVSTDKTNWSRQITLIADEDRFYLRVNSDKEGTFITTITATAGDYVNDDATVQAIVSSHSTFHEDFEAEVTTSGYNGGEWTGTAAKWLLYNAGIYPSRSEAYEGLQSIRFGKQSNSSIEMLTDKPNGIGKVEFFANRWSSSDGNAEIALECSTDHGYSWQQAGKVTISTDSYQLYTFTVNRPGNARLRIRQLSGARMNIDELTASNYSSAIPYDPENDIHAWDAFCLNSSLVIETAARTEVKVYSIDGILRFDAQVSGRAEVALEKGLYIVVIGENSRRVIVK